VVYITTLTVVNKVDGKIIGEGWFEEDLEESGSGLIGAMS
jgi:hypothetical protein